METLKENRGLIIFEGILFIILGILAIALPVASTVAAELFIGWLLIIGGVVQGYRTFKNKPENGFYPSLFGSLLNIGLGLLLLIFPVAGIISLALLLIFFFILQGIAKIVLAFQLKPRTNWGWIVFSGILSILMAILIIWGWPGTAFWVLGLLIGINMLFFGTALLMFGIAIPKLP